MTCLICSNSESVINGIVSTSISNKTIILRPLSRIASSKLFEVFRELEDIGIEVSLLHQLYETIQLRQKRGFKFCRRHWSCIFSLTMSPLLRDLCSSVTAIREARGNCKATAKAPSTQVVYHHLDSQGSWKFSKQSCSLKELPELYTNLADLNNLFHWRIYSHSLHPFSPPNFA